MYRTRLRKLYSVSITTMLILSSLISIFLWDGMDSAAAEDPLTPISTITGPEGGDNFGWNVSWVGDVNDDGYDDIIAGAPYADRYLGGDWWDNGWSYRKKLTFDNSGQLEDLVNFPALVNLSASNFDYSKSKLDGTDLRFIDEDGVTEISCEIESWNPPGNSYIWLNVTNIEANSNTDFIWMYYGNLNAYSQANSTGVWDSNYAGVWHLNDDFLDSTSNTNDGTNSGSADAAGRIADGQDFDGNDDYINAGSDNSIANLFAGGGGTIAAWIYPIGWGEGSYGRILDKSTSTLGADGWGWSVDNIAPISQHILFYRDFSTERGLWYTPANSISLSQWQYVVVTYDESSTSNDPTIYINSVQQTLGQDDFPIGTPSNDTAQSLYIGNFMGGNRTFNGAIDEIRISNIARSTDWIRAQYLSMNNSFLTYGAEETKEWWNASWSYRKKLTFDNSGQSEDLVNFPILVNLSASNFDYSKAKLDGTDLRFIDEDGFTELKYHIENWNTSGSSYVWVNVTNIAAGSSTDYIWMYYGNLGASNTQDVRGTYDENYIMVQHLNETSGPHYDSTSNDNDGTPQSGLTQDAEGKIDGADDFDGSDDCVNIPDHASLSGMGNLTIETWVKFDQLSSLKGTDQFINFKGHSSFPWYSWQLYLSSGDEIIMEMYDENSNVIDVGATTTIMVDTWYHVAVVYPNSQQLVIYINGEEDINWRTGTPLGNVFYSDDSLYIGGISGKYLNGSIDEAHISNVARSADWLKAQYLSMNNSFLTYGAEETKEWWNASWSYRKKLTFDNSGQSEDLLNFPVLVNLSASNLDYSKAKLDGTDLRFIDEDGTTELKYHIEDWNTSEDSYVWVNVTNIAAGSSTDYIWMYYGNPSALDVQDVSGTYNTNYMGVWHLNESSGNALDSTSYGIDGTPLGGVTQGVTGPIDGAYEYDGSTGNVSFGDPLDGHLDFGTQSFTISLWANIDQSTGTWQSLLYKGGGSVSTKGYLFETVEDGSRVYVSLSDGSSTEISNTVNIAFDTWVYLTGVINRTENKLHVYKDGSEVGSAVDISAIGNLDTTAALQLSFTTYPADAIIDEVRISNVARSLDWIKAQYLSMNNSFITYSGEETFSEDCGAAYIFFGHPGITLNNIDATNANVTIYGSNGGDLFGWSVSDAGDVNNDGYDDVIIGAPGWDDINSFHYVWNSTDVKVNQNTDNANQFRPVTAVDSSDNKIVVWFDDREDHYNVYAQKLDSNGNVLWGSTDKIVNQNSDVAYQMYPAVALDSNDNAIIVWEDNRSGDWNIYAQKLDSNGNAQWGSSDKKVNQNSDSADQVNPDVALDSSGNAIVVWEDNRTSDWDIYAQKLDSNGNALWGSSDKGVNQNSDSADQVNSAVAITSSGNAIVVWEDERNGAIDKDIYGQKLNSTGDAQWGSQDKKVNQNSDTEDQMVPDVDVDLGGNAIVVWYDNRNGDNDIYAQKLDTNGNAQWDSQDVRVNLNLDGTSQVSPSLTVLPSGIAIVVWFDNRDGNWDIYAQKLNVNGEPQWSSEDLKINQNSDSANQYYPDVALDSNGDVMIVWEDSRNIKYDIYAQKIDLIAEDVGRAYIFYGRDTSSWSTVYDADNDADVILTGENEGDRFGFSVSGAGDMNNVGLSENFYEGWLYRKKITIISSQVVDDLSDFPVLINVSDSDLKSKARSDGYDIFFTELDGVTKLDHEIERYNSSNGELVAWVKVPNLYSTMNTIMYMYYGNQNAPDQSNPSGVWTNGYRGVWHLSETSGDALDSTSYGTNGTISGTVTQGDIGKIDGAYTFNSTTTSNVDMGDPIDGHLDFGTESFTLSIWIKDYPETQYQDLVYKGANSAVDLDGYSLYHRPNDGEASWAIGDASARVQNDFDYTQDGTWRYLVGVANRSSQMSRVYVNGIEQGTGVSISSLGSVDSDRNFQLSENSDEVNGIIDEVRISSAARSAAWIATEYNNQNDTSTFYTVGNEEINSQNWQYRKPITIDASKVTSDLTDFPMLINIIDSDLQSKARLDGYDIIFTKSDGRTTLDHEIECYNGSSGELIAWVKIPSLSSFDDAVIYMYYGNSSIISPSEDPAGVWDTNYMGVWHLSEASGNALDSTTYGTSGALNGAVTQGQTGKVGLAYDFGGAGAYVNMGDPADGHLDFGNESFTYSTWVNVDLDTGTWEMLVWKGGNTATKSGYGLETSSAVTNFRHYISDGTIQEVSTGTTLALDTWYYLTMVIDRSSNIMRFYRNGTEVTPAIGISGIDSVNSTEALSLSRSTLSLDGLLDEVRIIKGAKTADWITTEFNNQNDTSTFYTVGNEEIIPQNWLYRKPITISASQVTDDLTDFPMLIQITDTDLKSKARSDGYDIIFTGDEGWTRLDHEIERYNSSSGELIAWVKIPFLSSTSNTVIYIYYGNPDALDQQNIEGVWSNGFVGVYHMVEETGNINNSASASNDGTRVDTPTRTTGQFGYGQEFTGSGADDYFNIGDLGIADGINENLTISAWANIDNAATEDWGKIVSKRNETDDVSTYRLQMTNDPDKLLSLEINGVSSDDCNIAKDTWVYITATYNGSERYIFINETQVYNGALSGPLWDSSKNVYIGVRKKESSSPDYRFGGILDEVRLSKAARSASWVVTEFNNQNDTSSFYTVGNEEQIGEGQTDNYDDVIVGAYGYGSDQGRAYIFYGGPEFTGEISAGNASVIINSTAPNDRLGWDVSRAGDVNDDGFGDMIIGAPGNNGDTGAAYIFYGNISMPSFIEANDADEKMFGSVRSDEFGYSVSYANDMNDDGYDDVIVGAPGCSSNKGRAYIFFSVGHNDIVTSDEGDNTVTIYNGTSSGAWEAKDTLSVGNSPHSVFVGDANNDGYSDILTANFVENTVTIYNGTSGGGWESSCKLSVGTDPRSVFVSDANNDGLNDIVTADHIPDTVTIYNGTSSGGWEASCTLDVGLNPYSVFVGDANNDGYNDIVTADENPDTVTIYNGTSSGVWEASYTLSVGGIPRSVFIGDANNDGYNDIVTADYGPDTVTIYNGTSSGGWEASCTLSVGLNPRSVFVGDANNDGYNDILTANQDADSVTIYNGSSGGWEASYTLSVGIDAYSVFVGDANNDGYNDILTADYGSNTVTVYNGTSNGGWETKGTLSVGGSPRSVFVGNANNNGFLVLNGESTGDRFGYSVHSADDMNGDGVPDVVVGAPYYDDGAKTDVGTIYVFEGGAFMDGTADWSYKGEYANDHLGWSASFAGDICGDGLIYLIVGAPNNDDGDADAGKAYLLTIMSNKPLITNVLATPSIQNIDGYVNITADVTAISGVDEVWVNITLPGGGYTNVSMTQGIGDHWFYNDNYTIPGLYQYTIWANNTFGNWTESSVFQFQVINSPPLLSSAQVNPLSGYTDTGFNFTVTYTDPDNHAPNNITVNITSIGVFDLIEVDPADTNYSDGKEYYYNTSGLSVGLYSFHFAANDTLGDWDETVEIPGLQIFNTPPILLSPDVDPLSGTSTTYFNFTVNYTDLDDHSPGNITLNLTGPSGGTFDIIEVDPSDINYSDGKQYYYNTTLSNGSYSFHFAANDSFGNWYETTEFNVPLVGVSKPIFTNIDVTPNSGYVETWFNFTVNYSHPFDKGPDNITLNLTGLSGGIFDLIEVDPFDTNYIDGKLYYYNVSGLAVGSYSFKFAANDTDGNWSESGILGFEVLNRDPVLTLDQVDPITGFTDTRFNFTVTYTDLDNHAPFNLTVNITGIGVYDLIEVDPLDIDYTGGKEYYYNATNFSIGQYSFHFAANDTIGNWTETGILQFDVINRVPTLSLGQVNPTVGDIDTGYNFSIIYTDLDNHLPDVITVNITGIGIYDLFALDSLDLDYTDGKVYYYNTSGFTIGSYSFNFAANDTQGDWIETTIMNFDVIDRVPTLLFEQVDPNTGYTDTWFNFTVTYADLDNHAPNVITVNITGIGVYDLFALDPLDMDYTDGKEYYYNISGFAVGQYSLHFASNDTLGNWIETGILQFDVLNRAPILSLEQVDPTIGYSDTWFNFTITYTDLDNHMPYNITLNLTGPAGGTFDLVEFNSSDTDYSDGKEYYLNITLTSGLYSFHFAANDSLGLWAIETTEIGAPDIIPKHGILYVVDRTEEYSDDIHLNATLLDDYNNPIPNENVAFYIDINKNGGYEAGEFAGIGSTLVDGSVSVIYSSNLAVGTYYYTAVYVGSGDFVIDDGEALLTIIAKEATLTATSDVVDEGEDIYLTAILMDNESDPIGNEQVAFYIDKNKNGFYEGGEFIGLTTTSASGIASVSYTVNLIPESYGIIARYLGSSNYAVSEIEGLLIVQNMGNIPPTITGIVPDQIKPEDSIPWALDLTFYEGDVEDSGPDLKWYLTGVDTSLYSVTGMNSSDDVFTFIPVPDAFGNDEVILWLEDSSGDKVSQVLWVNITPVNDPPYFAPSPPNLYVHYDDPSTDEDDPSPWDYTFYVHDIETPVENLVITTSEPTVNTEYGYADVDGLKVTFHYPQSMVGQSVLVFLTLSDGTDTAQAMILVNVTSDWVPELVTKLPNVVLEENSTLYNVFDLDDYFIDRDADSLYFSSGYFNIKVNINENNTVDITALGQWTGSEFVTFRAEDPIGAIAEDTITVTVIPVNNPPEISGVPNLVVHYDYSYAFDLSPYISDPDNLTSELIVWTSEPINNIWLQQNNNLGIVLNYPELMNGTTFPVTIYVSDGMEIASQQIQITVTNNFPPELIYNLPDVFFDEDTILWNAFCLSDYFYDIDSNVLYYTNGTKFINATINENLTVDFSAPENWYGFEWVTFRATDPSGALAEDKILVVVVPVNDAPTIDSIPKQEKEVGDQWLLDLSQYIDDIDNNASELIITIRSEVGQDYITLAGNILMFQYPEGVREDIITITVSDGELEASRSFTVDIKSSKQVVPTIWDLIPWPWVFLFLITGIGGAFAFYKRKSKYLVYEAFLIHENGLPMAHVSQEESSELEDVVVSGMFTAVQNFINDTFSDQTSEEDWELDEMKFGDHKILIERSQDLFLAVIFEGYGPKLRKRVKRILQEIDEEYGSTLKDWDGDMAHLKGVKAMIASLVSKDKGKDTRGKHLPAQSEAHREEFEDALMDWEDTKKVSIEELGEYIESVEEGLPDIVKAEEVEVIEIEVIDCPVCGKEIDAKVSKCPRCGVEFVGIKDTLPSSSLEPGNEEPEN